VTAEAKQETVGAAFDGQRRVSQAGAAVDAHRERN
jgi:hypothetical protein